MEKEELSYEGFILVEIMIVIAIISTLAAIAIPVFPAPRTSSYEIRWNNP